MSYSDFAGKDITEIEELFSLTITEKTVFIPKDVVLKREYIRDYIFDNLDLARKLNNERARSGLLVDPVMREIKEIHKDEISLFIEVKFDVDKAAGLNGNCDYLISLSPVQSGIKAPVIVVGEAKKELSVALGQCIAEMVAASRFNIKHNIDSVYIYGGITTGEFWQFLRFDIGKRLIEIDPKIYDIGKELLLIFGILSEMILLSLIGRKRI